MSMDRWYWHLSEFSDLGIFESQCSVILYREMCIIQKSNLYIPEVTRHYTEICKFPVSTARADPNAVTAHLPGESFQLVLGLVFLFSFFSPHCL